MDRLIVAVLLPIRFTGIYEVGARLNTYSRYAINVVFVIMPAASTLYAQGKHGDLRRVFIQGSKLIFGAYALVAMAVFMLGRQFITLWIGTGFELSATVAQILVAASLYQSQNSLGHVILVGMGRLRVFTAVMASYPIAIVALCSGFGTAFGIAGVAVGVLVSVVALETVILLHLLDVLEVRLGDMFVQVHLKVIPCLIVSAVLVWILDDLATPEGWKGLIFKALALAGTYSMLFIVLAMSSDERREMSGRLRRAMAVAK